MAQQHLLLGTGIGVGDGEYFYYSLLKTEANFTDLYTNYTPLNGATFTGAVTIPGLTVTPAATGVDSELILQSATGSTILSMLSAGTQNAVIGFGGAGLQLGSVTGRGAAGLQPQFFLSNIGNFGVGTDTPQARVHTYGNPEALRIQDGAGYLSFYDTAGATRTGYLQGSAGGSITLMAETAVPLVFGTSSVAHLWLASTGTLSLGTQASNGTFTVAGTGSFSGVVVGNDFQATGTEAISQQGAWLQWNSSNGEGETNIVNQNGSGAGGITFGQSTQTNARTEWGRFASNGYFGIGLTTPQEQLHVSANVAIGNNPGAIGNARFTPGMPSPVSVRQEFGTDGSGWQFRIASNHAGVISDIITVSDTGNVGMGGNVAPAYPLDVAGIGQFSSDLRVGGTIYDTANTGYFVKPSGVSVLDNLTVNSLSTPGSGGVFGTLGEVWAGQSSGNAGAVSANNWFRSFGNTGWYSQTYGGGIYMTDGSYIRTYNNKNFLVQGASLYVDGTMYDNANTGYYLKPSGQSVLDTLNVNGTLATNALSVNTSITAGSISATQESQFSVGTFVDPDINVSRAIKIGGAGLAVYGGIKTDTLSVQQSASVPVQYGLNDTGATQGWIHFGTWSGAPQYGAKLSLTIQSGSGLNAQVAQDQTTEIFFKTSNGADSQAGSSGKFYADGYAVVTSPWNQGNAPSIVTVVQIDANTFDFYGYFSVFSGGSFYTASNVLGTWTNVAVSLSASPEVTGNNYIRLGVVNALTSANAIAPTFTANAPSGTPSDYSLFQMEIGGTVFGQFGVGSGGENVWNANTSHVWQLSNAEYARLTTTGLGVGTSTPAYNLHVNSSGTTIVGVTGTQPVFRLTSGANVADFTLLSSYAVLRTTTSLPLLFGTNSVVQATLDTAGNFGVGVTPLSSVPGSLQIAGQFGNVGNSATVLNNNTTGNDVYQASGYAARYFMLGGVHNWQIAGSGTAGTGLAWNSAMSLNTSAQLMLGTTVPLGQLTVAGTAFAGGYQILTATAHDATSDATAYTHTYWSDTQGDFNTYTTYSSVGSINATANTPFGNSWYTLFNARHRGGAADGANFGGQIAIGMTAYGNRIAFRSQNSGTWGNWVEILTADNTGGGAASVSVGDLIGRNPNNVSPDTSPQSVRFDFVQSSYTNTGGNYAGVMTVSPYTGTTASTGDASYQFVFGSSATNGSGTPELMIRNGIDTTWNAWYQVLHSGNYGSFSTFTTGVSAPSLSVNSVLSAGNASFAGTLNLNYGPTIGWDIQAGAGGTQNLRVYDTIANVERFRIDNLGNVGVGVVPNPNWYTSYSNRVVQFGPVGALFSLSANIGNQQVGLLNNTYMDNATGNFMYQTADGATMYKQVAGQHQWWSANAGTAGAVVPWTQFMTLNPNGTLLLGGTADNGAGLLQVNGAAWINGNLNVNGSLLQEGAVNWLSTPGSPTTGLNRLAAAVYSLGNRLETDETFANGVNNIGIYDNATTGTISMNRISSSGLNVPTNSGYVIEFIHTSTTTSPNYGGFFFGTNTRANATFACVFKAKLPAGYQFVFGTNATGSNGTGYWATDSIGTGKWEDYVYVVRCGDAGTFASTNYFSIAGSPAPSASAPITWYLASASVYDVDDRATSTEVIENSLVVGDTNVGGNRFAVVSSSTSGLTGVNTWGGAYSVFGPNANSTTGAALALGYNTTTDQAEIFSAKPGSAWKPLELFSNGLTIAANGGSQTAVFDTVGRLTLYGTSGNPVLNVQGNTTANTTNDLEVIRTGATEGTNVGQGANIVLQNATNNSNVMLMQANGGLQVFTYTTAQGTWAQRLTLDVAGNLTVGSNLNVPGTIYDSSNGGYYLKATGSSVFNDLTVTTLQVGGPASASSLQVAVNGVTAFQALSVPISGQPNQGTYNGYLLLARAYPGSGFVAESHVIGTFTLRRGGTGSGDRVDTYDVQSNSAYNSEGLIVKVTTSDDVYFLRTVKVTYNGVVYHAVETTPSGGLPDNGVWFTGTYSNCTLAYVDGSMVSAVTAYGYYELHTTAGLTLPGALTVYGQTNLSGGAVGTGSLYLDAASGNQVIQVATNSLGVGAGFWAGGNSALYSTGALTIQTGVTLAAGSVPTGGTTAALVDASGNMYVAGAFTVGATTAPQSAARFNVVDSALKTAATGIATFGTLTGGANDFQLLLSRTAAGASTSAHTLQSVEQGVGYRNLLLQPNGGSVGIGVVNAAPRGRLDVNGNAYFANSLFIEGSDTGTGTYGLVLDYSGTVQWQIYPVTGSGAGNLSFHAGGADRLLLSNNGDLTVMGTAYDGANTGYYLKPSGTSNLNVANVQNAGVAGSLYFGGVFGNTDNTDPVYLTKTDVSTNVSDLSLFIGDDGTGTVLANPTGGATGATDYLSIRSVNLGIHHLFGTDGSYVAAGTITAQGNVDAQGTLNVGGTIYDSANTGYYLKPSGTSVLNSLTVNAINGQPLNSLSRTTYTAPAWQYVNSAIYHYWTKIATLPATDSWVLFEVSAKNDVNYTGYSMALVSVNTFMNTGGIHAKLDVLNSYDMAFKIAVDNSNNLWIWSSAQWDSSLTWRVLDAGSANGGAAVPTIYTSGFVQQSDSAGDPPNSVVINVGQQYSGTQGSVTATTTQWNSPNTYGSLQTMSSLYIGNGNTNLLQAAGGALQISTPTGWVQLGSQTSSYTHVYASLPLYIDPSVYLNGTLYDYTNTGYYLKPSGTSVLSALNVGGSAVVTNNGGSWNINAATANAAPGNSAFGWRNRIINGGFVVAQRGNSFTGAPLAAGYTIDRWLFSRSGTGSVTVSQVGSTSYGGTQCAGINGAFASGEVFSFEQRIEAVNCADLAGQQVTVSFDIYATTSAGSVTISAVLAYPTATDNYSATPTTIASINVPASATPQRVSATFTVPTAATTGLKLAITGAQSGATGTIQAYIGAVQLEAGPTATPFETRPIGTEVELCQRYYERIFFGGYVVYNQSTSSGLFDIFYTRKRGAISFAYSFSTDLATEFTIPVQSITRLVLDRATPTAAQVLINATAGNGAAGGSCGRIVGTLSSYMEIIAEL